MTCTAVRAPDRSHPIRPGTAVRVAGVLVALCCVGFAAVNLAFELTDRFADSAYVQVLTVENWLVAALKVAGVVVAVASVTDRPRFVRPTVVGVAVWAAFAVLGVYSLGSLAEAVGMLTGVAGSADQIEPRGVAYLLFFLLFAAGFGVLAVSHSRRHRLGRRQIILGMVGAPVVLGMVLVAVPAVMSAVGMMPAG